MDTLKVEGSDRTIKVVGDHFCGKDVCLALGNDLNSDWFQQLWFALGSKSVIPPSNCGSLEPKRGASQVACYGSSQGSPCYSRGWANIIILTIPLLV